ncbi:hypothetical protein GIB67_030872 [Kingdonia uniflora]|uniref:Uncharacterized protein n=1 Tax=Kingdonia uniflora TaxID=39325 RepID=A0A7J7L3H1_9MAGN|nr:hypothetical protein GIB67_030872 [Kingdonia uniflora]
MLLTIRVFNIYISLYRLGEEVELRRSTLLKLYYNRLLSHSPTIVTGFVIDCWLKLQPTIFVYIVFKKKLEVVVTLASKEGQRSWQNK